MSKYTTKRVRGYWEECSDNIYDATIALESWDGVEDYEDEGIFFYMDGEPLTIGAIVGDGFVITEVEE
jgi:hypothetical protein